MSPVRSIYDQRWQLDPRMYLLNRRLAATTERVAENAFMAPCRICGVDGTRLRMKTTLN